MYVNLIQHEGELKDVVLTARIYSGQGDAITEAIKDLATEIVQAEQVKEYIVHDTFPRGEAAANPRRWNGYYTRELQRALDEFNRRVSEKQ